MKLTLEPAFSTSVPRTLLSIMIFCAVALGAVVFLQNLEINSNSTLMKAQGIEVQQKNNIFLINLECVNGKTTPGSDPAKIPQEKVSECVIANQNIGDYLLTANGSFNSDEETQGNKYTFNDVMSVVDSCSSPSDSGSKKTVKFEHGKSLSFNCADTSSKKNLNILSYR